VKTNKFSFDVTNDRALSQMLENADVVEGHVHYDAFFTFIRTKFPDLADYYIEELIFNCPRSKESERDMYVLNEKR
jgi:hypothetical protein